MLVGDGDVHFVMARLRKCQNRFEVVVAQFSDVQRQQEAGRHGLSRLHGDGSRRRIMVVRLVLVQRARHAMRRTRAAAHSARVVRIDRQ